VRRVLFWMHLGTGVLLGVLVLFFAITGALLAYERPIVHAADEHFYRPDPLPRNAVRLPLDELLARAAAVVPTPLEMLIVHRDPNLPVVIETAGRSVYFVDPYSGRLKGPASPRTRVFFAEVTGLHRWFGLGNANHRAAIAVKGVSALLFLFLLVSGPYLWMPRRWTRNSLRLAIVPRFDAHGRARYYNWHKITGFWLVLPLAVVVTTGVIMAYPWVNALLFHLAGSPVPMRPTDGANQRRHDTGPHSLPIHLDQAFALATSSRSDWQIAALRVANNPAGLTFTVDSGDGGNPQLREQVLINPKTLQVLHREPFAALSRGRRWRSWVRFAHTGEAGGWWGETLAFVTACGAVVLSLTGFALSFQRLERGRRRG
jgi:uncharacterized iron-regulated membrane protein